MDLTNTLWLDTFINNELREGGYRRDRIKRYWDGYIPIFFENTGTDESAWNDIGRKERMAQACYDV